MRNGSCSGIGCCQNSVPKGLNRYDISFGSVYNISNSSEFNPCSYAALVETATFNFSSEYITTKRFNETYQGRQPMVLDWVIGSETCEVARSNKTSYACLSANSVCVDSTNGPGYLCNCTMGYEGNPYLLDGCKGKLFSLLHTYMKLCMFCSNMNILVNLTIVRSFCITIYARFSHTMHMVGIKDTNQGLGSTSA